MLQFSKIALTHSKQNWKSVKEKVCVNICTDFCLSKKVCSASWGCSIRSLVICRLLTLLFIKCAFHKWHRSSLWPPPSQTLTYYVGCDQATDWLKCTYKPMLSPQRTKKKIVLTSVIRSLLRNGIRISWCICTYLCVHRLRSRKTVDFK